MEFNIDHYFLCLSCKSVSFLGRNRAFKAPLPRTLTCESCSKIESIGQWNDSLGSFETEEFSEFAEFQLLDSFITDEEQKGINGEELFTKFLNENNYAHIFMEQSQETFAQVFSTSRVKRPDFLIALKSNKTIFVDVKNRDFYSVNNQVYLPLNTSKQHSPYLELEKTFQIPVWFAYVDNHSEGNWLWISAQKAINNGYSLKDKGGNEFLSINIKEFAQISDEKALEALLK